jgi:hypothetical protein
MVGAVFHIYLLKYFNIKIMDIFWFFKYEPFSSFLRITDNLVPLLKFQTYSILPPGTKYNIFSKSIYYCEDIKLLNGGKFTYKDFKKNNPFLNEITCKIKYIFIQALYFCKNNKINKMVILTGLDEAVWYNDIINNIIKIKDNLLSTLNITFYIPFDYISDKIIKLRQNSFIKIISTSPFDDLPVISHAIDPIFKHLKINKNELINIVNNRFGINLIGNEIIILNANVNTPRKRIQLTVDSFNELVKITKMPNLILWLHSSEYNDIKNIPEKCIFTKHLTSDDLNLVYNICQIGLQTSSGEGWSFTNCEHAICGGIQVVPNFLATGYHFADERGILIKTTQEKVGEHIQCNLAIKDIVDSLIFAINSLENNYCLSKCLEYFSGYKWINEASKLNTYL